MQNIFKGLLFIFFNFSISLNACSIGLIPDFYGYYLIWKGFQELRTEHEWFTGETRCIQGIGIYSGIQYGMAVLGITSQIEIVNTLIHWGNIVAQLYVVYRIVIGIQKLEQKRTQNLQAEKLQEIWEGLVTLNGIVFVLGMISSWLDGGIPGGILGVILLLVGFICKVYFLDRFSHTKDLYYGKVK